mmetsp:Transcript_7556/g.16474  ORF Transcript_7556/g.16474 Transcript_7556/m.16474 type:complete len:240 (-) Transcript_7556:433-1152(-)
MLLHKPLHVESTICGLLQHTLLRNYTCNVLRRGNVERRVPTRHIFRGIAALYHFLCGSLLYLDFIPVLQLHVQRREWTRHEEFHSHLPGHDGKVERSDLVRRVPVGAHAIGPDHACVGPLAFQIARRHGIANQCAVHLLRLDLIRGQARPLVVRPRFQRGYAPELAPALQFARHAQRGAPASRGEGAGVADGHKAYPVRVGAAREEVVGAVRADSLVVGDVALEHVLRVLDNDVYDLLL